MFFIPLAKADVAQRLVFGSIDETPDRAGEVLDYATAKPAFEVWSETMAKASGGKNLGNVRAQHDMKKAAGHLVSIAYDDTAKRIDFCALITDDQEWAKVDAGTYTGFSPGGSYAKRWRDGQYQRYTPKVGELSIVDMPCIPSGTFSMIKADGSEEDRDFVLASAYEPGNDATRARAEEMAKASGGSFKDHVVQARADLIAENAAEALAKMAAEEPAPAPVVMDSVAVLEAALAKAKAAAKDGPNGDVEYADPVNKKYPIDTAKHIRAAWSYINMPKNQKDYTDAELDAVKAKIVAAWKAKINKAGPPEAEKMAALGDLAKFSRSVALIETRANDGLAKGLYTVGRLAQLIDSFADVQQSVAWESEQEGDNSPVVGELANAVAAMGTVLIHMVNEEVQEIVDAYRVTGMDIDFDPNGDDADDDEAMEQAHSLIGLAKAHLDTLEKAGARNSKGDATRIQTIHDKSCELGACCADASAEKVAGLEAERDRLAKAVDSAVPGIERLTDELTTMREAHATEMAKVRAELTALGKQPAPSKVLSALAKEHDNGGLDPDPAPEKPMTFLEKLAAEPSGAKRAQMVLNRKN